MGMARALVITPPASGGVHFRRAAEATRTVISKAIGGVHSVGITLAVTPMASGEGVPSLTTVEVARTVISKATGGRPLAIKPNLMPQQLAQLGEHRKGLHENARHTPKISFLTLVSTGRQNPQDGEGLQASMPLVLALLHSITRSLSVSFTGFEPKRASY
jgi:hypothetical protein